MREIRLSGLEGGVAYRAIPTPIPSSFARWLETPRSGLFAIGDSVKMRPLSVWNAIQLLLPSRRESNHGSRQSGTDGHG